jgi:hypothetical protein
VPVGIRHCDDAGVLGIGSGIEIAPAIVAVMVINSVS